MHIKCDKNYKNKSLSIIRNTQRWEFKNCDRYCPKKKTFVFFKKLFIEAYN